MELREQSLSLLASANNHGDLSVKLSSLRQVKDLLLSSSNLSSSIASHVFPFLVDLHSSPQPLVRKLLLQVIEEIGLSNLEHSSLLIPVLLALLKDGDPDVVNQSIISGTKFFSAVLEELAWQFHRHGKVERWTEEMWIQMIEYKNAVLCLVFEPVSVGTRLLALKFLETFLLLFTPDETEDRPTSGGSPMGTEVRFNISWLAGGHPVLDASKLLSEANRFFASLLDMLRSSSLIPGPLTIASVNCLSTFARKRPNRYDEVLSAILDFHSKSETRTGHTASLQYSVRTALLGFLRCIHPAIIESRDKVVRYLRSMNIGDAVDQALRHADKLMRNNERLLREARPIKEDQSSHGPYSGDPIKRKLMSLDNEEPYNGSEAAPKRMRYNSNGNSSTNSVQINEPGDGTRSNGIASELPMVNTNPVEQMIIVIGALLAEGERGADSLELLITQIHPDLLADIVISNMKHLPRTPPIAKPESLPLNGQSSTAASIVQGTEQDCTTTSANSIAITPQGSIPTTNPASAFLTDLSSSTILPVDSKRDPRRDPRRLDPRRVAVSVEAPLPSPVVEATNSHSRFDGPTSVNKTPSLTAGLSVELITPPVPDANINEECMRPLLVSASDKEMANEEAVDEARETLSSTDVNVVADHALSPALAPSTTAQMVLDITPTDAPAPSFVTEFDDYSPPVQEASASEEICIDLPQVPPYVDLSYEEKQTVIKLAVARIVRSFKELKDKDICKTRMAILARLVSWMEADDLVITMVQEDIVLDYRDQQGHELVMHVLYHLHCLMTKESSDHCPGAAALYEKFLLGVAKSLLDTLPASDKSFSRLLGEAPTLTDSVMRLLENLCCPDGSDHRGKDIRDDRITQGLGAVWSLILGRPLNRQACLTIALKCAAHTEDDTRAKAIRLVANKLYQLHYVSEAIEQFATKMLLSAVEADTAQCGSTGPRTDVGADEDSSAIGSQLSEPGSYMENIVKAANPVSQTGVSMSVGEAQRLISMYFALCTKKPALLQLVFDVYGRSGKGVKQAIHRHIPILLRSLGSSYSQLLSIISDPPTGSENLLMLVLQILAEQTTPPPDLINTVKHLYETKLKDATILIPMLSSLPKHEVLPIFPRLVDLPLDKFQQSLAHILQGSAHTGPALTPAEVLVAIHDIVPDKEGIALKKVTDACSACFEQRTVFTQQVLAKALNQMVDKTPLPLLFMRTVIQAIDAFPTLVDFVMEVLSKLVRREIWKSQRHWAGFMKCVSQTPPHSFHVLLQLPVPQLNSVLNKYANLRGPLAAYSSQPSIRSTIPRPTLVVLGLES